MSDQTNSTIHVADGGFRLRPGQLDVYAARHKEFLPHVTRQPGFRETYGGVIANSPWSFFVGKFDSLEAMEQWNTDKAHVQVQNEARDTWWTAYYLRKGRLLGPAEEAAGQILCETVLLRDAVLSDEAYRQLEPRLSEITEFGSVPYETLSGETIATPYLFSQLLGIIPQHAPVYYTLLTYWRSTEDCARWRASAAYHHIESLGSVSSSCFQIIPERKSRLGLRPDRMQREWQSKEA